ncbi:MAG: hypothetical protein IT328_14520 [Caldilineaceae bacterium]|nr:hypothetical protein [Caldilineaceae bacterium]
MTSIRNRIYYKFKPLIPRRAQVWLRSRMARRQRARSERVWPILERAGRPPDGWPGWPEGRRFALVLVHDVELAVGQSRCLQLMQLEQALGFRSVFNFVPERYRVDPELRATLARNGFEVGVHGLLHDGKLFESRAIFLARAQRINQYLREWQAVGFCSPSSHHQLDWMHDLDIEYDSSTFDTDPFEPQPDGLESIFPLWIAGEPPGTGFVEFPYTLVQDYTLFILLGEKTNDIWKRKLCWIADKGGLAFLITHPDYMSFAGSSPSFQEYPVELYREFLEHVQTAYEGQYWHALPREVASFCHGQHLRGQAANLLQHSRA